MKLLHSLAIAAALLLAAGLVTSCNRASGKQKSIAIVIPVADHGWTGGIISWAEKAKADIEQSDPSTSASVEPCKTAEDQVKAIEALLIKGVNCIVLLPIEPKDLAPVCEKIKKQGVKLIVVDRTLPVQGLADVETLGNNRIFGENSAKAIAKELNGKGLIICIEGMPCQVNTDRVEGFKKIMADYPNIKLEFGRADWDEKKAADLMESKLMAHKSIDAVWAGDDDVLRGVLKAYEKSGRKDVKIMTGGGGSQFIIGKIKNRDPLVKFTVSYPPKMIYDAAMLAHKGDFSNKKVIIATELITPENADKFILKGSRY